MKIFTLELKDTIFHTFHDISQFLFCFWTGNKLQLSAATANMLRYINVNCHCIKLHSKTNISTKRIYMGNGQLELCLGFIRIYGFSFQRLCCLYGMYHRPTLVLVLINHFSYSYSCNNQVLVLVLTHITSTCSRARKSSTRPSHVAIVIAIIIIVIILIKVFIISSSSILIKIIFALITFAVIITIIIFKLMCTPGQKFIEFVFR